MLMMELCERGSLVDLLRDESFELPFELQVGDVVSVGHLAQGEHLPEEDPITPHVGAQVELARLEVLRGEPLEGQAYSFQGLDVRSLVEWAGEAKVTDFGHQGDTGALTQCTEKDVPGGKV